MVARPSLLLLLLPLALAGCDLLGIETLSQVQARHADEGRAIGSACRHAGRAIEDCYALNKKADKAAMFAGWREMNDYMTENKIPTVMPAIAPPATRVANQDEDDEEEDAPAKPGSGRGG
jgi:hypothetical protein